jgi:hypothetical protein
LQGRPIAELVCGGQRGVDTWAAVAWHDSGAPVHLVLPYEPRTFAAGWDSADRRRLESLLAAAQTVQIVDPMGSLGPLAYDLRNERVAAMAGELFVIWTGAREGGTFYTVCAAVRRGLRIHERMFAPAANYERRSRGI